jgi:hypothetical protein
MPPVTYSREIIAGAKDEKGEMIILKHYILGAKKSFLEC